MLYATICSLPLVDQMEQLTPQLVIDNFWNKNLDLFPILTK